MKKFLCLAFIMVALFTSNAYAQPAADPENKLQQMKEKQRPGLIENVGLTAEQADKVIELNYEMRMKAADFQNLDDASRSKKIAELKAEKEKKFAAFLTPEQITAMHKYYESMGKRKIKKEGN